MVQDLIIQITPPKNNNLHFIIDTDMLNIFIMS